VNFSLMHFWLFMNIATFFLYAWDKRQAKREAWRVSERKLLLWAFFGGAVGAFFAMFFFTTKHGIGHSCTLFPVLYSSIFFFFCSREIVREMKNNYTCDLILSFTVKKLKLSTE